MINKKNFIIISDRNFTSDEDYIVRYHTNTPINNVNNWGHKSIAITCPLYFTFNWININNFDTDIIRYNLLINNFEKFYVILISDKKRRFEDFNIYFDNYLKKLPYIKKKYEDFIDLILTQSIGEYNREAFRFKNIFNLLK